MAKTATGSVTDRLSSRYMMATAADGKTTGDGTSVGLFIRLPDHLAGQFPRKEEDKSPPHVTLLYVGEVSKERENEFVELVSGILATEPGPIRVTLGEVDHFVHTEKQRKVFYSRVRFSRDMASVRNRLAQAIADAGFVVKNSFPLAYMAHSTIDYVDGLDAQYEGPAPKGSWDMLEVEIWGLRKDYAVPLGSFAGMQRTACIIAAGEWEKKKVLLKNRDRNYRPKLKIVHEVRDGVEIAYVTDEVTGWVEGLNETGLGVVNSALAVLRDEQEGSRAQHAGRKNFDGDRVLTALTKKTVADAVKSVKTYRGGLNGHTFVADNERTVCVEMTKEHEPVETEGKGFEVRTNHGIEHEDAGYTEGEDLASSQTRYEDAISTLKETQKIEDIGPALMRARKPNRKDPKNMVRDTNNMRTTSQMVLNLTDLEMVLYLMPGKVQFLGVENKLPKGREPKIKVSVFKYQDKDPGPDVDLEPVQIKSASADAYEENLFLNKAPTELKRLLPHTKGAEREKIERALDAWRGTHDFRAPDLRALVAREALASVDLLLRYEPDLDPVDAARIALASSPSWKFACDSLPITNRRLIATGVYKAIQDHLRATDDDEA